jgi:hypothetical protein
MGEFLWTTIRCAGANAPKRTAIGAVETILVDIDQVTATGGRVIGVRKAEIPGEQSFAAVLRYPV